MLTSLVGSLQLCVALWPGGDRSIGADRALDEEIGEVVAAREIDPDDPTLLVRYAELLGRKKDLDGQIAYSMAALDALELAETDDERAKADTQRRLLAKLPELDSSVQVLQTFRDTYLSDLAWAMQLYAQNQKKHYNALEVCDRILSYRPSHARARDTVRSIAASGDEDLRTEAERLLHLGDLERTRAFLAEWQRAHDAWRDADVVESASYTVRTNIGYEELQIAAQSLEQIARFFRRFWSKADPKLQVGKTEVFLCKRRDEWVAISQNPATDDPGTYAFLYTTVMTTTGPGARTELTFKLYGFDPRDMGRPLATLWPTLWHEASHQYMALSTRGGLDVPPWLNEGMAAYFEGAFLGEGAEVFVGAPARERLDQLYGQLRGGEHPLEVAVSTDGRISFLHYPAAWGLVYYLRHARGEDGGFPLRACLDRAVELAAEGPVPARTLFDVAVLAPAALDLAAFEKRWEAWIVELFEREAAPRERAMELVEAARVQLAAGRDEIAAELFADALLRAPDDPRAMLGLAHTHKLRVDRAKGRDALAADRTLMWARRAHRAASSAAEAELVAESLALAQSVDRTGFKRITDAEASYRKKLEGLIARQVEKGRPRTALAMAKRYVDDVLGSRRAESLAAELRAAGTLALERPVRVFDGHSLVGLSSFRGSFAVSEGELVGRAERPERAILGIDREFTGFFRFEGELWLGDPNTMGILVLRQPRINAAAGFALRPAFDPKVPTPRQDYLPFAELGHGEVRVATEQFVRAALGRDFVFGAPTKLATPPQAGQWVRFRLIRERWDELRLELDGAPAASLALSGSDRGAALSFVLFGGQGKLRELRAVELDRL